MKKIIFICAILTILILSGCANQLNQDMTGLSGATTNDIDVSEEVQEIEPIKTIEKQETVSAAEEDNEIKTCNTARDCDDYCVLGLCQTERPRFPVLEDIRLYNVRTNNQVRLGKEDFYVLENAELYYILVKADNKRNMFKIIAESDKHFGSKGSNENNRRDFRNKPRSAVYTSSDVYEVRVSNFEPNHEYPFFFNVLASPGDKFNIKFYVEDGRDETLKSQEKIFPVFIVSN